MDIEIVKMYDKIIHELEQNKDMKYGDMLLMQTYRRLRKAEMESCDHDESEEPDELSPEFEKYFGEKLDEILEGLREIRLGTQSIHKKLRQMNFDIAYRKLVRTFGKEEADEILRVVRDRDFFGRG